MKKLTRPALLAAACSAALLASWPTAAEDIDIFVANGGGGGTPNVLIVLDNTSNWSRQSQQWPGGAQQGQSEVNAIKRLLSSLDSSVNLGLMEYVTGGNANDNGGFVRYNISPMTDTNKSAFSTKLTTIYDNITSPNEKRNSNTPYGNLMYDVYNYYAGANSYSPNGVLASPIADDNGYTTPYTRFKSPLSTANSCGRNYIIFIGNPNHSGPATDSSANTAALKSLGGDTTQLRLPEVGSVAVNSSTTIGNTSQCFPDRTSAEAAYGYGWNSNDSLCQLYAATGTLSSTATDRNGNSCKVYTGTGNAVATNSDFKTQCSTFTEGCTLKDVVPNPTLTSASSGLTGYLAAAPAATAADAGAKAGLTCPADAISCSFTVAAESTAPALAATTASSNSCYWTGSGSNPDKLPVWSDPLADGSYDHGTLTCPANYSCTYTKVGNDQDALCQGNSGNVKKAKIQEAHTGLTRYTVTMTVTKVGGSCPVNTNQYTVVGTNKTYTVGVTGNGVADTAPFNADEWARFLYNKGVPVADSSISPSVTTYTIDVYNKQPNAQTTSLLMSMALAGGGRYFAAKNEDAILNALKNILVEIKAVNTTFASTSLPVNATNRTQNLNQVFIGMFRPDRKAKPRWFGNLKQYQLINTNGAVELGDKNKSPAVNNQTGFLTECAASFWTVDSGKYWNNVADGTRDASGLMQLLDPESTTGKCDGFEPFSDLPDGPLVEKGAVAEILRRGNNPPATDTAPTYAVNRQVLTMANGALTDFSTSSTGLSQDLVDFIRGADVNNEKQTGATSETRPSIHGDVIHSRPLPINYGGEQNDNITVFYGSNDGAFRAVDAKTGRERFAFIAPEFNSRLARLKSDSPLIYYPKNPADGSTPKDYYFDGSTGVYQNGSVANPKIWVYPSMRRGGRMLYALDVTNPDAPVYKWRAGCPNLGDDTGCTNGMSAIGQTWSTPNIAWIKGYTSAPVIAVGGGYDSCEDADTASPSCGSTKGNAIFILDAFTGTLLASFPTTRAVAADVAFVDADGDGKPDYAYAADTGGNIYRVDFVGAAGAALSKDEWTSRRVAYTNGSGRKFLFTPAVYANSGKVYIAIGSGDRERPLALNYPYTGPVLNRFYVYKDDLTVNSGAVNLDTLLNYSNNTSCTTAPVLPNSVDKGWYMELNAYGKGEQTVTSALIAGGMVTFSTNRPVTDANACSASLGEARGYWVNLFNASGAIGVSGTCGGTRSSVFVGGGLPPSPVLATSVPIDNKATTVVIGAAKRTTGGANVSISPQELRPIISSKRVRTYSYTKGEN